jgi:hypothetical protein
MEAYDIKLPARTSNSNQGITTFNGPNGLSVGNGSTTIAITRDRRLKDTFGRLSVNR